VALDIYVAWRDLRRKEFYLTDPPIPKTDIWATIQDFYNPVEGTLIPCTLPPQPPTPATFKFFQSFPNPTRSESIFVYDLPEAAEVRLSLYDILGKDVKILITEYQAAGSYFRSFTNNDLPSGVYFAKMVAKTSSGSLLSIVVKVILLK